MEEVTTSGTNQSLSEPCLSAHTDFRKFLKEHYEYKRAQTINSLRPYSYANFSAAANIKSPNYLKLIIEGKRNLSETMMVRFAKALQFNKAKTDEFKILVKYGQAEDPLERNRFLRELAAMRNQPEQISQKKEEANGYSWLIFALHALVDQEGTEFTVGELRDLLQNRASQKDIKACLDKLVGAGELVLDPATGQVVKGKKSAHKTENLSPALIRKLQAELIYLGMESLIHGSPRDREFGSLTMALTEKEYQDLKFELRHLRKRIYRDILMAREKTKGDRVFQLNFQLFPISKKVMKKKK